MIIVVAGLPASGKSYLAKRLAENLNMIHLNTDIMRKELFSEKSEYSHEAKQKVYDKLFSKAEAFAKQGKNVILDGTFYKKHIRDKATKTAKNANVPFFFVFISIDFDTVKKRMLDRKTNPNVSEADLNAFKIVQKDFEPITQKHLILNALMPVEEKIEKVQNYVKGALND